MKGSGAVGVATLDAARVGIAQDLLAATQLTILPPVQYLDLSH